MVNQHNNVCCAVHLPLSVARQRGCKVISGIRQALISEKAAELVSYLGSMRSPEFQAMEKNKKEETDVVFSVYVAKMPRSYSRDAALCRPYRRSNFFNLRGHDAGNNIMPQEDSAIFMNIYLSFSGYYLLGLKTGLAAKSNCDAINPLLESDELGV